MSSTEIKFGVPNETNIKLPEMGPTTNLDLTNDKEIEKQNMPKGVAVIKNLELMEDKLKKAGIIKDGEEFKIVKVPNSSTADISSNTFSYKMGDDTRFSPNFVIDLNNYLKGLGLIQNRHFRINETQNYRNLTISLLTEVGSKND
jgi:hypothetical protein